MTKNTTFSLAELKNVVPTDVAMQEAFDAVTATTGRNGKLALKTSAAEACKDGSIPVNHYAIDTGGVDLIDLGKTPVGLVISFRALALDWSGKNDEKIGTIVTADIHSEAYKAIVAKADKDSKADCLYGPEFLVYLPEENKYVNFLMAGWNARTLGAPRYFKAMKDQKPIILGADMKEGKHGKNFYPICDVTDVDVDLGRTNAQEMKDQILAFNELSKPSLEIPAEDEVVVNGNR